MSGAHGALFELGFILLVLFAGGVLAARLKQSVIPAYILIGLISRGFVREDAFIGTLAEAGLVLLLFFIGLEFSLRSFLPGWKDTLRSGMVDLGFNFPVGTLFGLVAGMGMLHSLYLGAIVYMSSTAIITKTMVDNRLSANPESAVILKVLVFEDLLVAVLMALLAGLAAGGGGAGGLAVSLAGMAGFLVLLVFAFRKGLPIVNRIFRVESQELFIMLSLGFVVVIASAGKAFGISEAVGAFVAGMLFAETEHKLRLEEKLSPFKDLFAAIFFLDFGMGIDYAGIGAVVAPALALAALGFVSKMAGGWSMGRIEGLSDRASIGVGVGLLARGEFSIILAGLIPACLGEEGLCYNLPALAAVYVLISGVTGAVAMKEFPKAYFWYVGRKRSAAEI